MSGFQTVDHLTANAWQIGILAIWHPLFNKGISLVLSRGEGCVSPAMGVNQVPDVGNLAVEIYPLFCRPTLKNSFATSAGGFDTSFAYSEGVLTTFC